MEKLKSEAVETLPLMMPVFFFSQPPLPSSPPLVTTFTWQVKPEETPQAGDAGGQCGTGSTTAGGSIGDPTEAKGTPKRLHVSNIPFRFRDPDLRQMFGVRSWEQSCPVLFNLRKSIWRLTISVNYCLLMQLWCLNLDWFVALYCWSSIFFSAYLLVCSNLERSWMWR